MRSCHHHRRNVEGYYYKLEDTILYQNFKSAIFSAAKWNSVRKVGRGGSFLAPPCHEEMAERCVLEKIYIYFHNDN